MCIRDSEIKPYEVEVFVAEVGEQPEATQLFRIQFDGTLRTEDQFGAIGGQDEALREKLSDGFEPGADLNVTLGVAAAAIEAVEEREIPPTAWEAAVLDRNLGRRKFRRLDATEIEAARQ